MSPPIAKDAPQDLVRELLGVALAVRKRVRHGLIARGHDLRTLLRGGASDDEIADTIARVWRLRADRYSEIRSDNTIPLKKVEMSHIGG